jgi:hypothetical protein
MKLGTTSLDNDMSISDEFVFVVLALRTLNQYIARKLGVGSGR